MDTPPAPHDNMVMGEVTDYLDTLIDPARSTLERLRQRTLALVPEAEEGTSYGMAALRYRGRPLISVVSTRAGYSVFPFSSAVVALVVATGPHFDSTKGGIRFTECAMIPDSSFDALVTARQAEIDAAQAE